LIQEIKLFLNEISKKNEIPDISIEIDGEFDIEMPLEKGLSYEQKTDITYKNKPVLAKNNVFDSDQLSKVFDKNIVDKKMLTNRIRKALSRKKQTTLLDVIKSNGGIEQGLPELFGYFSVLKHFTHNFNQEKQEEIVFDNKNFKSIIIPEIILLK